MVVVLSPIVQAADSANDDQALADKEPIMASLNLKAMPFDDVATVLQREMVAHLKTDDDTSTPVSQPNRILSVSKLEEISAVLPMITELGKYQLLFFFRTLPFSISSFIPKLHPFLSLSWCDIACQMVRWHSLVFDLLYYRL